MTVYPETLTKYPPVSPDQVVVYEKDSVLPASYKTIARIRVQDALVDDNIERVIALIKKKAGSLGANGIILGQVNEPIVPASFKKSPIPSFRGSNYNSSDRIMKPVEGLDPETQGAWGDVEAIFVKTAK